MRTFFRRLLGLEAYQRYITGWVVELDRRFSEMELRMTAYDDMVERLKAATDEVASDLNDLKQQLSNGLSAEDAASRLAPVVERLEAMGKDSENPVPEVVTDPATTTDPTTNAPPTDETLIEVDDNGEASVVENGSEPPNDATA